VKIVCLVKQIPDPAAIEFDEETKTLKREGVPLELNEFDRYAVAHAVALREQLGGEVVAMTMGPPQAEACLHECLSLGADRCIHLSDRAFAVADTLGTSRTLSFALQKEGADLVVCGRKTLDSETWQVPPEVAAFLGHPHLTNVAEIAIADGDRLRLTRETDSGSDLFEAEAPLVISVARPPGEGSSAGGGAGDIEVWQASDLVGDVQEHDKRFGQTGSPTRVLAVRDAQPERKGFRTKKVEEATRAILELLAERAPERPSWDKPGHIAEQPGRSYDCWTACELVDGRPRRTSLELIARGRELAGKLGGQNVTLVLGHALGGVAQELGRFGAEVVCTVDDPVLAEYHPELWAEALRRVLEQQRPHILLIPATTQGRDFGPRAAGELELGMTGDCVGVDIAKAGRLLQQKPAYGGTIVSVIMGSTTPQLATVRPRMYEPLAPRDDANFEVRPLDLGDLPAPRVRLMHREQEDSAHELEEADVVSLLGLGIGGPEPIPIIEQGAAEAGAAVGGTREVCEAGWLPRRRHVGLLGRPVAPRLLVAVGVRGDKEELPGFVKAGVVVAVGAEHGAPLLEAADVVVTGDWRQTLRPLHEAVSAAL
jgi:electron transfer flavoprotein alpha subunit